MHKFLALVLSLSLFVGCTNSKSDISNLSNQTSDTLKIALVTDQPPADDENIFLSSAISALDDLQKEFNFHGTVVHPTTPSDWATQTDKLCADGYNTIIGVGWQAGEAFQLSATQYDDINFAVIDCIDLGDNIKGLTFDSEVSYYIQGVMLATAFPYDDTFGYIGNYADVTNQELQDAYSKGLQTVNKNATVVAKFANTYNETELVKHTTKELLDENPTISAVACSVSSNANKGAFELALEYAHTNNAFYLISMDDDQTTSQNPYILGGSIKSTGAALRYIVQSVSNNTFTTDDVILPVHSDTYGVVHMSFTETDATQSNGNYLNKNIFTSDVFDAGINAYTELLAFRNL